MNYEFEIRRLWSSVVVLAVRDLDSTCEHERRKARRYFAREDSWVGSVQWICEQLDLDVRLLRAMITTRDGRRKLTHLDEDPRNAWFTQDRDDAA
jgi:hypothetical protein